MDKVYQVKQYREFPFKKDNDPVVKEFEKIYEARQGQKWFTRRAMHGEKFYVMDRPHEPKEATEEQELKWATALKNCGLS